MFRTKTLSALASIAVLSSQIGGCSGGDNPTEQQNAQKADSRMSDARTTDAQASGNTGESILTDGTAKNLVLFVGDGMGISTITAARIHEGQKAGRDGESNRLSFERFPHVALVTTYNYDAQVADSAGTATQMMSGYRTRIGQINVTPDMPEGGLLAWCTADMPPNLLERAKAAGKRVGAVSTARITHATPAAVFAQSPDRGWEAPGAITDEAREAGCTSIAEQLLASEIDLALGGGARAFEGLDISAAAATRDEMLALPEEGLALGLFTDSHMAYEADRDDSVEPSLAEMTTFAMERLDNPGGYVLMVEAGRIDHAHHGTNAYRALEDTIALSEAVEAAVEAAGDDTLILVTADHSHVFTIAGYPARGNPILGHAHGLDEESRLRDDEPLLDLDGDPYTTLGYYNGGSPTDQNLAPEDPDYRQRVAVRLRSETHAGEDVALYATGPGSQRVRGAMDQTEIADVIDAALGLDSSGRE